MLLPMRVRSGVLQVPTCSFAHPEGHRIELIGVAHLAQAAFWTGLNEHIASLQASGYLVHFETMYIDEEGDPEMVALHGQSIDNMVFIADALGLQHQGEGLDVGDDWVNVDISGEDLHEAGVQTKPDADIQATILKLGDAGRWRVFRALDLGMRRVLWRGEAFAAIKPRKHDALIMDHRSTQAAQVAMAEQAPVVMIWGAAHLSQISGLLKDAGYRRTGVVWRSAMVPASKDEVLARLRQLEIEDQEEAQEQMA